MYWLLLLALSLVLFSLFFPAVRLWIWKIWKWQQGRWLAYRARKNNETDPRKTSYALDAGYNDIKAHYRKRVKRDIEKFRTGKQNRVLKRIATLKKMCEHVEHRIKDLKSLLNEENESPSRDRPRIKGLLYYSVATLLAIADIAITFMALQSLNYPVLFLLPSAFMLGIVGFLAGDFLGKNIEPAQKNPNPEKNRMAIILLATFSALYCIIFGTIRFLYTQRDPHVPLALNIFGSYGFIFVVVGCAVMLGWLHEGMTTKERIEEAEGRLNRLKTSLERCDRHGSTLTSAFKTRMSALDEESKEVRGRFHDGFDSAWRDRAPYGVQAFDSALFNKGDDDSCFDCLVWPDPPRELKRITTVEQERYDLDRYLEPAPSPESPPQRQNSSNSLLKVGANPQVQAKPQSQPSAHNRPPKIG